MAESVRELVVTMSLDAGSFAKTCTDINTQIKGVEAQFNAITAGVGSWQSTMAGREAKMNQLTQTLAMQQARVTAIADQLATATGRLMAAETPEDKLKTARAKSALETQLYKAQTQAMNTKAEIEKLNVIKFTEFSSKMTALGNSLKTFGRKFSMYIGGPLAALGIKSFNLAQDYETAMTRLQIASQATDEEILKLDETILNMSGEIPVSYTEIADLMKVLSEAGVPIENLETITRQIEALKATSDITDENVTDMIRFMKIMNVPLDDVDKLSSALFSLGINSVATSGEIFAMANRMAATGALAGFSAQEILALATAYTSLGINAEAGGTAANKLAKEFQLAAETGAGAHASLEQISSVMGITVEQFKNLQATDPAGLMLQFFDSLKNGGETGNASVLALLDSLGITEARMSALIATAANNPNFFAEMLDGSITAWNDTTAAVEATEKAYGTSEANTTKSLNLMENAAADVGNNIVNQLQPLITTIGNLAAEFGKLDESTQDKWVKLGAALIIFGPAAGFVGTLATGIGTLVGHLAKLDANGVTNWSKLIGLISTPVGAGIAAAVVAGGAIYLMDQYLTSISGNTTNIINGLKNIEIGLDETKYKETSDAIKAIQDQSDALSGKTGEYNANISAAVVAGHGTQSMYGTALGYQARLSEQEIADIAGQYADEVDRLNAAIGAAINQSEQAALATERDRVQAQWDADVAAAKQYHMDKVSALVSGMMAADPAAKAALEQAAKDYDVIAALTKAQADVMKDGVTPEQTDAIWKNFFTPEIMGQYFAGLKYEDLVPGAAALDLENKLVTGLSAALETAGGETSLANTLLQGILDNPLTADAFDATKVSGALDGIVELLDFKTAGETAGTDYGAALTTGLADGLTAGTELATTAATTMAEAVDTAFTAPLGIQSPSTVMIQHGLETVTGVALGVLQGIPLATAAMQTLESAMVAQAAASAIAISNAFNSNLHFVVGGVVTSHIERLQAALRNLERASAAGYGIN